MSKTIRTRSSFLTPKTIILLTLLGCLTVAVIVATRGSFAATPASGTLTDVSGPVSYSAGPFNTANASPIPQVDTGPRCNGTTNPCDNFALTLTLPAGYHAAHPNAAVKFTLGWGDTGSGQSDYDLYIYKGTVGNTSGSQAADSQSAGGSNPEVATFSPVADGSQAFSVKIVPYTPTNEIVNVKIELLGGSAGPAGPVIAFGGPDPTTPGVPRYQNFYAPNGTSAQPGSGEFNIGFDPITRRIMTMNTGPIWRLTPGEVQVPSKPECCEALWEDKSANTTNTGLDPILWTDQKTGRTFVSNSTTGANAVYAYTDAAAPFNDGDLWVEGGFSPPNGGADHETIGSGPYPASLAILSNATNQGEAVYYCSQAVVGPASCQRSDDLGVSYGPGVVAYTGAMATDCGGLHGHIHVAPNGTAWLPVNQCGGKQGGAVSTNGGVTWNQFIVTGSVSQSNGADPSVGIDSASTAYYCYVNNEPVAVGNPPEGHVHVKVSTDGGATWIRDVDLGTSHGIVNAAHTEAVGGSAGRAACGFIGTNVAGDYQSGSFTGKWYAFIATTYDGGLTWTTVNATPNDPVQSMTGIWQQGGGNQDRNLLDFNEITVDDKGRVLYGYSDGCTSGPCIAGTAGNDYTAYMRVARQFGGKPILAAFDVAEPTAPKPSCLSGTRDSAASHLDWKIPDNGGSDITGYQILRGTTAGSEVVIVNNTGSNKNSFDDTTALPSVPHYFYVIKAINGSGTGLQSNEVDLTVTVAPPPESACNQPGLTILTDPPNDELDMLAGHDVQSLRISEPLAFAPNKVIFTLKMQSLATVPPNTEWPVTFNAPNGINYTARMTNVAADGATTVPIFQVGPTAGPFVAAAAGSNFNADGTITIIAPTSAIGNPTVGQSLSGFLTRIASNVGAGTITPDNMPDSLSPTGSYTIIGNQSCSTATPTPTPTPSPSPSVSPTATPTATPTPTPTPTPTAIFQFSAASYVVPSEGCTAIDVTVNRTGVTTTSATVDVTSSDATAKQKGDYTFVIAHLVFAANETQKTFQALISDDSYTEGTESANLLLQNPVNGTLGAPNAATLQIIDNTPETTGNPIDISRTFVGQHYHDFLYRQSDQSGEDFWTNQIEQCGADAQCRQANRVAVSGAFFLSIEFKQTGYLVIRAHKAGFGNGKGTPRYPVFLRDQREITNGLIVGQGNWQAQLDANKQAFLQDFVSRSEFTSQAPFAPGVTASTYVDALFANSSVTPTSSERSAAISAYGSGDTAGRAAALKSVIESGSVFNKLYNDSFVLMQYFGYLRRNPDDAPDNNFSGYDFWLAKLNSVSQAGEDMRDDTQAQHRTEKAEMIRAFIESNEYRQRFGGSPSGNQFAPPDDGQVGCFLKGIVRFAFFGDAG